MQTNYFKKALLLVFLVSGYSVLQAQVKIGNNPQNIDISSVLELESTNKAFVITRVNSVQMNAIVPLEGAMVYNTDEQCLHYYDGIEWINICEAFANNLTFTSAALANPGNFETITITQDTPTNYNFEVGLLNASNIQDGTIGTTKIVNGSVTQTKLATNSVNSDKISDKSIQTIDIAPGLANTVLQTNGAGDTVLWAQLDASTITGRDLTQGDNSITITNGLGATLENTEIRVTDGGISTAKLEDNAVTTAKILDANITDAKLDKANISLTGFAAPTADISMGTFKLTDVVDPTNAQDAATKNYVDTEISASKTLTDASIFIGDATNTAQALPITGEVTLTNAGVVTINDDAITTVKIADGAVTVDKIGATPADAGSFLVTNTLGVPVWRSALNTVDDTTIEIDILTGQLRVKDDGIITAKIADDAITPLKIDATIAGSGLSRDITTGVLSVNGAGVAGDGNITSTDLDVSGDTNALLGDVVIDINANAVTTTKIADDAVTATKINADVAGEGLEKNTTTGALDVLVDNATIEIDATNGLQVLANGITATQIADDAVTPLKIDASIAGSGISRDATTGILSVNGAGVAGDGNITSTDLDVSGDTNALLGDVVIDINANAVTAAKINTDVAGEGLEKNTTTGALDVLVDNATIEIDATNGLQVLANGITATQMADNAVTPLKIDASIAGSGISRDATTGVLSVNGAGVAGDGNITSTDLDVSGDTNALLGDVVIDINANAVTAAKINTDVAGEGLEKNTTTGALDVLVDNATIEIDATNGLQVLANGITATQIADDAVTPLKIDATIAGTGLIRNTTTGILSIDNTAIIGDGNITSDDLTVGGTANGLLENVTLEIAAGKVGTTELADDSVISSKIANGTIIEEDLANNAITNQKVLNSTLTISKLANVPGNPGSFLMTDASGIPTWRLATDTVDDSTIEINLANGQLRVPTNGITSTQIANNAITTAKILDANVTLAKIAPSTTNGQVLTTTGGAAVWATPTTGIPTGTAGSIFFSDGAGNLVENNAQLFWDSGNNRLGVGTNAPDSKFQVSGEIRSTSFASSGGTAGQPAYSFYTGTDTNTGMYRPAADEIGFSVGGIEALNIDETSDNTTVTIREKLKLEGTLEDINNSTGTAGQVLTSTGTGTAWQTPAVIAMGKVDVNATAEIANGVSAAGVVRNSVGNYTVNLSTSIPSADYIIQTTVFNTSNNLITIKVIDQQANQFTVQITSATNTSTDSSGLPHSHTITNSPIDSAWYFTITDF